MINIEHNIPIPTSPRARLYRFEDMKIGDSFFATNRVSVRTSAAQYKRRNLGWNFRTRQEGEGIRVWCTATPRQKQGVAR